MNRESLLEELRMIEGCWTRDLTKEKQSRKKQIIALIRQCKCRECSKTYDEAKARGEYKGFCSSKYQHAKAKSLGYKKGSKSEFDVLKRYNEVGSVYVIQ